MPTPPVSDLTRIDAVILHLVATTYNGDGIPVAESVSQPRKVFLGSSPALRQAIADLASQGL